MEEMFSGYEKGWIEAIVGGTSSGKSEELIRRANRVKFAGLGLVNIRPVIDTRDKESHIVSKNGMTIESVFVATSADILSLVTPSISVVTIDEAQFFDMGLVDVCDTLANNKKRVIIAGLDMDYNGKPFGPIPYLLAMAEFITKVHAICVGCKKNVAQYSFFDDKEENEQQSEEGNPIKVGNHYKPLCRSCFILARLK